jgi:integrase
MPLTKLAASVLQSALANPIRLLTPTSSFSGNSVTTGNRECTNSKVRDTIKEQTGLIDFRFHDLRHAAVSRLVAAGLSGQKAASISRHKSMQMLRRYTHLRAKDLVGKLDAIKTASLT